MRGGGEEEKRGEEAERGKERRIGEEGSTVRHCCCCSCSQASFVLSPPPPVKDPGANSREQHGDASTWLPRLPTKAPHSSCSCTLSTALLLLLG